MGSDKERDPLAEDDETPQHQLVLPCYYIARYPVTVAQFRAFVEESGYQPEDEDSLQGIANHPVVNVTWHDARKSVNGSPNGCGKPRRSRWQRFCVKMGA
jgi:formylglycine-generating enzyme required for sulfatase activity